MKICVALFSIAATVAQASVWDNESGLYTLSPMPYAAEEALRMDTNQREDQQPLGRTVRNGDSVTVTLANLAQGVEASLIIGFRPMWGVSQDQQIEPLIAGQTQVTANQDGPVFLRLNGSGPDVQAMLTGGNTIPLYVDGTMTAADWQAELATHKGADFVQLVSDSALITLTHDAHALAPVTDPAASFAMIDRVLALEDDLSGLDGSSALNMPTPLRQHFIVDYRATAADRQNFYMYATDGFIGLLPDNTGDLTNPDILAQAWGIWHEVGHIRQQNSWTWGSATEITVNIWSLYVQESLGNPSRLLDLDDGGKSTLARARDHLGVADGPTDFNFDDGDTLFIRLVMFDQLRKVYGWDLYRKLNQATRRSPLPPGASDQDRIDFFISTVCNLTGHDLRGFFENWGLHATDNMLAEIATRGLVEPPVDPARVF